MDRESQILNIRYKDTVQRLIQHNDALCPIRTKEFHLRLWNCLTSNQYLAHYLKGPILIALHPSEAGSGDNILDPTVIEDYLSTAKTKISNVFIVDYDGTLIENPVNVLIENPADASVHFSDSEAMVFFIEGSRITVLFKKQFVDCIPDIQAHNDAVKISPMALKVEKYEALINNHFKEKIENKTVLCYWGDKLKRILVASPESIFGNDLAYYLDQYISDGRVDQECTTSWTKNRTDIRVIRYGDGKIFIFEIKWLGKSVKSSYEGQAAVDRVNSGLAQLVEYMQAENRSICGVLVIYDARSQNIDLQWDVQIKAQDARIQAPIRYYLVSESASAKGDRIAKKGSKKRKGKNSKL